MQYKIFTYILFLIFINDAFAQETNAFFYVHDHKPGRDVVYNKVQDLISENNAKNKGFYTSYKNQDVVHIDNLNSNIIQIINLNSSAEQDKYQQLNIVNNWMSDNDWLLDLKNENINDILSNKLEFHFFFNAEDFYDYEEYRDIVDNLLHINRLYSYKNGEKRLNPNCTVFIYLRDNGFLKSNDFSVNYKQIEQDLVKSNNYKLDSY